MSKETIVTVVVEIDLINDDVVNGSTEFAFYNRFQNAINDVFDVYYNVDEWEIYDRLSREANGVFQHVFIFDNTEHEGNSRTVIVEEVPMDNNELEELSKIIQYND